MRSSAAICEHPAELSTEQTLLDSRRSSTAVATTPNFSRRLSLRSRRNHDHPSLSISNAKQLPFPQKDARALVDDSGGVSSRRMSLRTRESRESSAVSLDSTQASSIQSLHTTCSSATAHSNNRRQSSRKPAVTTRVGSKDEAEDEEVKLTIDILDSASIGFEESPVSPYATRSTVAACSVVSRRRSSTPTNNASLVSELMTPVGSTPASPVPEDPASPSGQSTPIFAAASPNSTRVIPLEPVSRTKTHAVTDTEYVTGLSISDPSERSRYSWSTLQWADVRVHVCYESSLWSSASCMACAESAGRCFLWPSCASRRITSGSAPKLDCDKAVPVFLQVKPEYLGVWGCEVLSPFELAEAWLGSKIRGDADIIRVRVLADTGDIIWVEYQSLQDFLGANPDLKPEINVGQLSSLFTQLSRPPTRKQHTTRESSVLACATRGPAIRYCLPVGSYVLTPSADQTTGPFDLYEADHPVSPEGASHDIVGRLDLNSVVHQFSNVSSNVVQLTSRISSTELLQSPWHSVHRLKLDLNLPACLNSSGVLVEPTGRDLRLPGLPLDRLVLTTENSPATKSSASEQSVRPKSATPKPINPKTASSTHRKVVLSTSVSGKAPPKRKLRSKH